MKSQQIQTREVGFCKLFARKWGRNTTKGGWVFLKLSRLFWNWTPCNLGVQLTIRLTGDSLSRNISIQESAQHNLPQFKSVWKTCASSPVTNYTFWTTNQLKFIMNSFMNRSVPIPINTISFSRCMQGFFFFCFFFLETEVPELSRGNWREAHWLLWTNIIFMCYGLTSTLI